MKVYVGSDHSGFALKAEIIKALREKNYDVEDCGAFAFDKDDDYPDFIGKAAEAVSKDPDNSRGIVIGGSGEAEAMVANKYKGIRCGLFYAPAVPVTAADVNGRISDNPFEIIRLSREHNNANMLSLSARFLKDDDALHAVLLWLETPFPGDARHIRRIEKIEQLDANKNY